MADGRHSDQMALFVAEPPSRPLVSSLLPAVTAQFHCVLKCAPISTPCESTEATAMHTTVQDLATINGVELELLCFAE